MTSSSAFAAAGSFSGKVFAENASEMEEVMANLRDPGDRVGVVGETEEINTPLIARSLDEVEAVMSASRIGDPLMPVAGIDDAPEPGIEGDPAPVIDDGRPVMPTSFGATDGPEGTPPVHVPAMESSLLGTAGDMSFENEVVKARIGISQGERRDDLRWNHAGTMAGTDPNIISELTWENVRSYEVKGEAQVLVNDRFRFEGSYAYGWIRRGNNQDSDYFFDNRQGEFSRSNNDSSGDNVMDYSYGIGVQVPVKDLPVISLLRSQRMDLAFLGGYAESQQNFRMTDGFQTIPATGAFAGLNSTYKATWKGPWVGLELSGAKGKWNGLLRGEYHWADYYAWADWNLRADFQHPKSYEDIADANGYKFIYGLDYALTPSWHLGANVQMSRMEAGNGVKRFFASSGTVSEQKFNESVWKSSSVRFGAKYLFK